MEYNVELAVMTKPKCHDPQAGVVLGLIKREFPKVPAEALSVGKYYSLKIKKGNPELARSTALDIAGKILANPVIEFVEILSIKPIEERVN